MTNAAPNRNRGAWAEVGALLLLALAFRVLFMLAMPKVIDTADAGHYLELAQRFREGAFFSFNAKIPVLYPALTAVASLATSDLERAAQLVSLLASTLLVLPVYRLSRRLHGLWPARIAALSVALWPWLSDYGSRVGPDALGCLLWFAAAYALASGLRGNWAAVIAAPFAFIALHLTRPEGTFLLAAGAIGSIVLCWRDPRGLWRLVPVFAIAGALLAAHAAWIGQVTGDATVNTRMARVIHDFVFTEMAATGMKTLSEVLPVMLGPVFLLFLGVGFFHRNPSIPQTQAASEAFTERDLYYEFYLLLFAGAQWFVTLFVLSPAPRYQMAVIITLSLWSARGMALITREAAAVPRWGRLLRIAPVGSLVVLMLMGSAMTVAAEHMGRQPREPREYKAAGLWMKEHLDAGLIFTRKPQVGIYAGMPTTGPDLYDSLDEALDRAKKVEARYLVVDERYTAQMVPGLKSLLDPQNAPPDRLELLQVVDVYPNTRVVIYRVK